ncbi:MAG: hypothetical protein KDA87_02795 [Planctomycetales bacterium]|nr:hypothetical protein [Planctomycetales bacterium]
MKIPFVKIVSPDNCAASCLAQRIISCDADSLYCNHRAKKNRRSAELGNRSRFPANRASKFYDSNCHRRDFAKRIVKTKTGRL